MTGVCRSAALDVRDARVPSRTRPDVLPGHVSGGAVGEVGVVDELAVHRVGDATL
jgi:hypothetical protein